MSGFSVETAAKQEGNATVTLNITGSITLCSAGELLQQLAGAFERTDDVVIDLSGVTEIDIAGLQLFCSCHRSSLFSNKGFRIIGQDQPAIWETAASAGYLRKSGCAIDTKHTCIWTGSPMQGMAAFDYAAARQFVSVTL